MKYKIPHFTNKGNLGSFFCALIVVNNGFSCGAGIAWGSAAFPKILQGETAMNFTLKDISTGSTMLFVGQLIATIPVGYLHNCLGKVATMNICIYFSVIAWLLVYFLQNRYVVFFGYSLHGIWISISHASSGAYIAEIVKPERRGVILSIMTVLFILGFIFEASLALWVNYNALAITNEVLVFFQAMLLILLPESPYYYLRKNRDEDAKQMLKWLKGKAFEEVEFQNLADAVHMQMAMKTSFIDIFRHKVSRNGFLFAFILVIIQRYSAFAPLVAYSSVILKSSFVTQTQFPIIFYSIYLIGVLMSGLLIDKIGRRRMLIISSLGSLNCSFISAIWFILRDNTSFDFFKLTWIPMVMIMIEAIFFSVGVYFIPGLILNELFPINIKGKALSLLVLTCTVISGLNVFLFMIINERVGLYVNFFIYALIMTFGFLYFTQMYDTKGKTLEAIQNHLATKGRRLSIFSQEPFRINLLKF